MRLLVPIMLALLATMMAEERPNILWLYLEDTSPWTSCYGHPANQGQTPHIDSLAARGILFERAYAPAPVCSPCRSAVITGANQIRSGSHEHRSSRVPGGEIQLPEGWKLLPQLLKDSGYYTFNAGKTDYNFVWDEKAAYDFNGKAAKRPWKAAQGKPFFGQIQMAGGKGYGNRFPEDRKVDPSTVKVPADYPQDEFHQGLVAEHLNTLRKNDDQVGEILADLEEDGLLDSTIVCWFSDHGANHLLRHKQMCTEGGLHVPLIITGPSKWLGKNAGTRRADLVNLLDVSASTAEWAGLKPPRWFEGRALLAKGHQPREFVAAARDRCDQTIDSVRSIRTDQFRYTRNLLLDRNLYQPQYRDNRKEMLVIRSAYADGTLDPTLARIYFGERPPEELYDLQKDPHQVVNLATDPSFHAQLLQHRKLMDSWLGKGDMGDHPEPIATYRHEGLKSKFANNAHNVEYEQVRGDHDGDGLSDQWEVNNGRDPADGRLEFHFDCGGWMTEGWTSKGTDALPGMQGFLDFKLTNDTASLHRGGLKLKREKNKDAHSIRIRVSKPCELSVQCNTQTSSKATPIPAKPSFSEIKLPLDLPERTESIQLLFEGDVGTRVEIDWIK